MSLNLEELVKKEEASDTLEFVRDNLYDVTRDYISHLRRERDECSNPHSREAREANDEYQTAKTLFDKLRAKRQQKINLATFSPGEPPRKLKGKLTDSEREYFEQVAKEDKKLRRMSTEDDEIGKPVSEEVSA